MICFTSIINGTIYPSEFSLMAQLTPHRGQVVPQNHFFLESYISQRVYLRSKVIVPRDAQHPKLYVHILVGRIPVIPLL